MRQLDEIHCAGRWRKIIPVTYAYTLQAPIAPESPDLRTMAT
jgi:hypothetical protein